MTVLSTQSRTKVNVVHVGLSQLKSLWKVFTSTITTSSSPSPSNNSLTAPRMVTTKAAKVASWTMLSSTTRPTRSTKSSTTNTKATTKTAKSPNTKVSSPSPDTLTFHKTTPCNSKWPSLNKPSRSPSMLKVPTSSSTPTVSMTTLTVEST